MDNNTEFEHSYLAWILELQERDDIVGGYARTVFNDFETGNHFRLIDTTLSEDPRRWDLDKFYGYCLEVGYPREYADMLRLGNAMAVMEFNVGLMTGKIQRSSMSNFEANVIRQKIAFTSDLIKLILPEIQSDGNI